MKSVVLSAAIAATVAATTPASAQATVRDREDVIIRDHEHNWNRHRNWYRAHAECRTTRVRTLLPNGKVVLNTRRIC
jgi:Ni/Co efflux regulator RcnB